MAFSALSLLNIKQDFIPGLPQENFVNGHYDWVVAHSTDNPNDTPEGESSYFHQAWQRIQAFVHFFVGTTIVQTAPLSFKAWGAGPTANKHAIHVELTEGEDFATSYTNFIALIAALLYDARLGVVDKKTLWSHKEISDTFHETDHQDPIAFLAQHGKSWNDVIRDVTAKYNEYARLEAQYNAKSVSNASGVFYRVYQGTKQIASFAYESNAVSEARKYAGAYVRRSSDNAVVFTNSLSTFVLRAKGVGDYSTPNKDEAISKGWEWFNSGRTDAVLIYPNGDIYTFAKHPDENPINFVLKANGVLDFYMANKDEAYAKGWELFNSGHTDVVLKYPNGDIYTFAKHPDENPQKPKENPTPQQGIDLHTVTEVINDANTVVTLLQKIIQVLKAIFRVG